MAFRNTAEIFGSVAKSLHWAIAVCFLISYCSVYYAIAYTVDGQVANDIAVQIHITTGIVVGVLVAVRVYWRLTGIRPGFLTSNDNFERAARVSHGALYACMIIQPITGYLGTFRDADYLGVTNFGDTAMFAWIAATFDTTWEAWEAPMDFVHRAVLGSKLIWMILVIHIGAALAHHFYWKDDTLTRMLPGRKR
jgi:cytochrome b561